MFRMFLPVEHRPQNHGCCGQHDQDGPCGDVDPSKTSGGFKEDEQAALGVRRGYEHGWRVAG
jgi:hypothetical protein